MVDRLFVYGTLRAGCENEHALALAKSARFVGRARIRGRLFRVAHYPGLVAPHDQDEWVKGDLFEGVSAALLQSLDEYEGPAYRRQLALLTMDDGRSVAAYLYFYALPTDGMELITSGDWLGDWKD
jgi:gamma-glutamylcyclotransferase (GGCT)/AIG2-like uncharacterized protein YtfP